MNLLKRKWKLTHETTGEETQWFIGCGNTLIACEISDPQVAAAIAAVPEMFSLLQRLRDHLVGDPYPANELLAEVGQLLRVLTQQAKAGAA